MQNLRADEQKSDKRPMRWGELAQHMERNPAAERTKEANIWIRLHYGDEPN